MNTYFMKHFFILLAFILTSYRLHCQTVMIKHSSYEICFDTILKQPRWTHYTLEHSKLQNVAKRTIFDHDDKIKHSLQQSSKSYYSSNFDKGHLSPNDDFRYNKVAQSENMLYTNCAPQNLNLNRGLWKELENYVDVIALTKTIDVYTGCLYLTNTKYKTLTIPDYFWKMIVYQNGKRELYVIPNQKPTNTLQFYRKNITKTFMKNSKLTL